MYTLVVVDVQDGYWVLDEEPDIVLNVEKAVRRAMQDDANILFLEYAGRIEGDSVSQTVESLRKLVRTYRKAHFATKKHRSGGYVVRRHCDKHNLPYEVFVCGIFGMDCVARTVSSLCRKNFLVTVIMDACDSGIYDFIDSADANFATTCSFVPTDPRTGAIAA